ncbi:MAG: hypothetical protein PHZ00_02230 [Candidatus Peribacteraceae bacterium]|nr:hypothetical protein [Candidatus Peribacteraceae bacterium]
MAFEGQDAHLSADDVHVVAAPQTITSTWTVTMPRREVVTLHDHQAQVRLLLFEQPDPMNIEQHQSEVLDHSVPEHRTADRQPQAEFVDHAGAEELKPEQADEGIVG